jgi:O-antigen/teichoic acid export membrane protein
LNTGPPNGVSDRTTAGMSDRAAAGATLMIAARFITRCIDLAILVVLGRLLSPADFGLVAIAMSVVVIVEGVSELPVLQALVRLPVLNKAHYDTGFTLAILRSALLALTLCVLAWPLARLYGDHRLIGLLCALWIAPAGRSLGSPAFAEFFRKLDFRPALAIDIAGKSLAFLTSVSLAWWTRSYWSIAAGTIAAPVSIAIISHVVAPYRPRLSLVEWREFASFLGWSTASQVVSAVNFQMDQLTLGRFISPLELGQFSMASNLANLPTQVVVAQVVGPLMVAFSLIREDIRRLAAAYQNSAVTIVAIGIPAMVGLSMIAKPGIRLVLGEQWLPAVDSLRWLSIAAIPYLFVSTLGPLSMALNRTKIFLRLSSIEFCIKLPLILIAAIYFGVPGVILVRLVMALVIAGFSMFAVRELTGLSMRAQLSSPWRPILSGFLMALAIWPLLGWLADMHSAPSLTLALTVVVNFGAAVYFGLLFLLWRLADRPDGFEAKAIGLLRASSHKIRLRLSH